MLSTQLLERVLAEALATGGDFAEVFVEDDRSSSISLEDDRLESSSFGHDRGAGVRVVVGEVTGYAHTDDLRRDSLLDAARVARAVARGSGESRAIRLHRGKSPARRAEARPAAEAAEDAKVELAWRANAAARGAGGAQVRQVTIRYADSAQRVQIANSEGLHVQDERLEQHPRRGHRLSAE